MHHHLRVRFSSTVELVNTTATTTDTTDNEASVLNEAKTLTQKHSFVNYEVEKGDLTQIEQVILDLANKVVKSLPNLLE